LGQVIGVATMVTREAQNLGFAIPVEDVELALVAPGTFLYEPSLFCCFSLRLFSPSNPRQSFPIRI
jgi:hypothetical protein